GAEVRRPFRGPRGRRGLQGGLQPAAPAISLLQRQRAPAARARPGLVAAGEVIAAPAYPRLQNAPGHARPAAGSGGTVRGGAHAGGSDRPSRRRGTTAGVAAAGPDATSPPGRAAGTGSGISSSPGSQPSTAQITSRSASLTAFG